MSLQHCYAMDHENLLRKSSFVVPKVNPFVHKMELPFMKKLQIIGMSLTVAPIRMLVIFLIFVLTWIIAYATSIGMQGDKPVRSWRWVMFQLISVLGRMQFFMMGFLWVEVKGQRASDDKVRMLVAAPHSSYFDCLLWLCTLPLPSSVSRLENAQAPALGTLVKVLQPVLVSRHDPSSRQVTIQEIERRASFQDCWPQIIIFPEGTCTNRKALITFKAGAFIPGLPVQPVILRYPNYLDTFTWTMSGPGAFKLLWISLCQFYNRFQVEFLPVYYPNEEEIAYPKVYANNVRQVMAKSLDVPCTDHTFEDCRLMYQAESRDLPMEVGLVEFSKLNKKLGIDMDEMKELLDEFASISRSRKDGLMGIEEFSQHLNLPITDALRDLFDLYDRDGSGELDFREYVIGMSLISQASVTEKTVKLAFKIFDRDGDGWVTRDELDFVLKSVFGEDMQTQDIFGKIDIEKTGKINYDQFYVFVRKRPEYAKLFTSYVELEQDYIPERKSSLSLRRTHGTPSESFKEADCYPTTSEEANILREKIE